MQPTEGMSIQRRSLDVEDYIDITRRHKGWIFGPFLFTLVVSVVGAYMWPDSYTSPPLSGSCRSRCRRRWCRRR